jgi:probable phosphoglycerate mutase
MITTVYVIRHGETDWNLTGRWQGHADVPLNELGLRQARLLGQRLAHDGVRFDAIYSSDLARAYQTAWELGAAVRVPVQLLPPLREIDLGAWSGLTYDEIERRFPTETELLRQGQDIPRGGGESMAALRKRVIEAVEAIVKLHAGQTLALVTHGGCVRALLMHAEGAAVEDSFRRYPHIGNTSVTVLHVSPDAWKLELVNNMGHLEAENEPELVSAPPDDAEPPQSL